MSVWRRIRWTNLARAAGAVAALALVIAWPRLGSAPPSVPDGAPVPARPPGEREAAGERPAGHVDGPRDDEDASSTPAPAVTGGSRPSRRRPAKTLVERPPGEGWHEERTHRGRTRSPTTGSRRERPRARSRHSPPNTTGRSRAATRVGARGGAPAEDHGVAAPGRVRIPLPTPPPPPAAPAAPPPSPPPARPGGPPSHGEFDFER